MSFVGPTVVAQNVPSVSDVGLATYLVVCCVVGIGWVLRNAFHPERGTVVRLTNALIEFVQSIQKDSEEQKKLNAKFARAFRLLAKSAPIADQRTHRALAKLADMLSELCEKHGIDTTASLRDVNTILNDPSIESNKANTNH